MTIASTLTPFLEPEPSDIPGGDNLVAGFKDERGERQGSLVLLPREIVERLILSSTKFTPAIDIDGIVQT